jgi:hypothetical protein
MRKLLVMQSPFYGSRYAFIAATTKSKKLKRTNIVAVLINASNNAIVIIEEN